jgi:cytidyltransferase-like protein
MTSKQRLYIPTSDKVTVSVLPWYRVEECEATRFPRPVVLINGCFDLLHEGHFKLLYAAREKAKTLLLALDSDDMVSLKKGPGRPILSWAERATALQYTPVDGLVEIVSDDEFVQLVRLLRPDFRVRGDDHQRDAVSRVPEVRNLYVQGAGMRTSEIIRRCQQCR